MESQNRKISRKSKRYIILEKEALLKNQAKLKEIVARKKECNSKALNIVETMLDESIDREWFLTNLKYINKSHFKDVVEERVMIGRCGYPLCDIKLINILRQTYKISTADNKIYDITERKNFCSSPCFKSYRFLMEQLYSSPLWLRDCEPHVSFKLYSLDNSQKADVNNISEERESLKRAPSNLEKLPFRNAPTLIGPRLKNMEGIGADVFPYPFVKINSFSETKQINNCAYLNKQNVPDYVQKVVKDWFTPSTALFLQDVTFQPVEPGKESRIIDKINKKLIVKELQNEEACQPTQNIPDYNKLKTEAMDFKIKVKSFLTGDLSFYETRPECEEDTKTFRLPTIHHIDVISTRRRIFLDKVLKILPNILISIGLSHIDISHEIQKLIYTFNLSACNISLNSVVWTLVVLVLIKCITFRNKELKYSYFSEETQENVDSLLSSYGIRESFLDFLSEL